MPDKLHVIHADPSLLVLNKPAGLLAVPGRGEDKQDAMSTRAQKRWPDAMVVHRLDMATSGLLVMARGAPAQRALSMAFAARAVGKRYEAVVHGRPAPINTPIDTPTHAPHNEDPWFSIDLPLILDWPNRPRSIVDHAIGKPSLTHWRLLAHDAVRGTSRLALAPVTGRSHQLRVHLQALGHPIVGDALYAPPEVQALAPRLLLHACELTLPHPATGETLSFHSPAPF